MSIQRNLPKANLATSVRKAVVMKMMTCVPEVMAKLSHSKIFIVNTEVGHNIESTNNKWWKLIPTEKKYDKLL